jgi:CHASE1-domain containing sensor protein
VHTALLRSSSEARTQFDRLVDRVEGETERRINQTVFALEGARGVFAASKSVERLEFRAYADIPDLAQEFPGVLGFGFIERVPRAELEAFVERERADHAQDFSVRTEGDEPDLFVVKFMDPLAPNRAAWGYDVGSDKTRREAVLLAVRSGQPTLTSRLELVQDTYERPGFLFLLPVYRNGTHPSNDEEREADLQGLVFAPLVLDEVLAGVSDAVDGKLDLEIFEGTRLEPQHLLYDLDGQLEARPPGQAGAGRSLFHDLRTLEVGGRTWSLWLSSTPKYEASLREDAPGLIGLVGLLLSALLSYAIWSLGSGRARALALAQRMTADLGRRQAGGRGCAARLRGHARHVGRALDRVGGRLARADHRRQQGLLPHQRLRARGADRPGPPPAQLGPPPARLLDRGLAHGHRRRPWRAEVCNRARNGSLYWIDAVIAPFASADGRIERYFSISTDVTARKQAEAEQSAALALATALARSQRRAPGGARGQRRAGRDHQPLAQRR